jgi:hypothetical protein
VDVVLKRLARPFRTFFNSRFEVVVGGIEANRAETAQLRVQVDALTHAVNALTAESAERHEQQLGAASLIGRSLDQLSARLTDADQWSEQGPEVE